MDTITQITPEISESVKHVFLDNMDKEYSLIYTDYQDNYNNSAETIQNCLNQQDNEPLSDNQWIEDNRGVQARDQLIELKDRILSDKKYEAIHEFIEDWLEEDGNKYFIIDSIKDRDTSEPVKEMIERTSMRGRVTLYTNYDCLPHNFDMDNTYYYDEYFKDIVDVLCLNPATVKEVFEQKGINAIGKWPDKPKRNGNEAIKYEDLADEMLNQCSYSLLTFMGMLPLTGLYENNFQEIKIIIVPKGNLCGMFSDWRGGDH